MPERKLKKECYCDKCGNEAEMTITCELQPEEARVFDRSEDVRVSREKREGRPKGEAVCSSCGSEADIWLEM